MREYGKILYRYLSFSSTSRGQLIICTGFVSIFEVAAALPPSTVFVLEHYAAAQRFCS